MFGFGEKPHVVYDPVVMAQTARALEMFGSAGTVEPSIEQIQAVASVIGEAASIVQAMATHANLALQRGLIDSSALVTIQTVHDINVVAWRPEVTEAALFNQGPIPAQPLAELFLDVTRRIMKATAGSAYHVTPTAALVDISAMPTAPTHVVVDPTPKV